jgi:5-methylcytosine-specific restriction endonuclease McrA
MTKAERTRACLNCGVDFIARRSQIDAGTGKFCSHRCAFDGTAHNYLFAPEVQKLAAERRRESVAINGTKHGRGEKSILWKGGREALIQRNREKYNKKSIDYRMANPEKRAATLSRYYKKNSAKIAISRAKWNDSNKEKKYLLGVVWRSKNKALLHVYANNRRALVKKCGGRLSKDISQKLFKIQNGLCACCRKPLGDNFHLDHIMPMALGGSNTDDNIQLLRSRCNQQKHAKHPVDFMQERGFLL